MADTKTANDWKLVAAELNAQIATLENQQNKVTDQINQLTQQQIKLLGATGRLPAGSAERAAGNQQYRELTKQIEQLKNQQGQLSQQIISLDARVQAAERQADIAADAPQGTRANPTTTDNPPPANPEPGNNTAVAPVAATITPVTGPPVDFDAGVDSTGELTVPPGTDTEEEGRQPGLEEPPDVDDALAVPPGTDTEEEGRQPGLEEPPDVDESDGGLQLPPGADPDEGNQPGLSEPPVVDEEFGDLEGAISRNQEDDAVRAETANLASRYPPTAAGVSAAQSSGNLGGYTPFPETRDYRVRISLAPSADYLYMAAKPGDLLYPLIKTKGVVYPYTPVINLTYTANYQNTDLTHTNYKIYNYSGSAVESINITGDFTAQDVNEANYVLAVIHFFRSVTKMFYGQDQNAGVPPPLVYLTGHGEYGFDNHAMVITNFTLNYPNDCDYINAGPGYNINTALNPYAPPDEGNNASKRRLRSSLLQPGGVRQPPMFSLGTNNKSDITRVPTKLNIQLNALPVVSRYNISNNFSLARYATGDLLRGSKNVPGGGMW